MLVKPLEEAIVFGSEERVKAQRLELNKHLETKQTGCIVTSGIHAMGREGINAVRLTRMMEAQCDNNGTI